MKQKILSCVVCALLFGAIFVYWPRGRQTVTINNTCSGKVCETWVSSGGSVQLQGIPYKTYLGSRQLDGGKISEDDVLSDSKINIAINFLFGVVAGITVVSIYYLNNFLRKAPSKKS